MLDRRQLIGATLAAAGLGRGPAWLQRAARSAEPGAAQRVLVVLALRGGNDGLNTVVPFEDDRYHRARPTLALPRARLLPLDELRAFHPSLERSARAFAEGELAIVQGVGYPHPNLSHFRSMDVWESASVEGPLPAHGWIGKAHTSQAASGPGSAGASPLALLAIGPEALPRALWSDASRACSACAVPDLESYRVRATHRRLPGSGARARERLLARLQELAPPGPEARLRRAWVAARDSIDQLRRAERVSLATRFPRSGLGRDLELVARVLAAGLPTRYFHVAQGGYDTHTEQLGTHAGLLRELDLALDAFRHEMKAQRRSDRVLVLIVSEFGRRVQESGSGDTAGTDHGAASIVMLMGERVRPGTIGAPPDLDALDENGNLIHTIDFRSVYAGVLSGWMGVASEPSLGSGIEALPVVRA